MTHSELVKELSAHFGKSQKEIKQILDSLAQIITESIDKGQAVSIPGFGVFSTQNMKARKLFNPDDKNYYLVPEKRIVRFAASSLLKSNLPGNPV